MAPADAGDVLAYLDSSRLFEVVAREWELFKPVLLPRARWEGTVDELRPLRNRNAHCRRPHADDVPRLELLLRDLEAGARSFYGSYAGSRPADLLKEDPVVKTWIGDGGNVEGTKGRNRAPKTRSGLRWPAAGAPRKPEHKDK